MKFETLLKTKGEFGKVTEINHPLVKIEGLNNTCLDDTLVFENNSIGKVYQIEESFVIGLLFDNTEIELGNKVVSLNTPVSVPLSNKALGKVIDPLGRDFYTKEYLEAEKKLPVDRKPLGIDKRLRIKKPLKTGVLLVDLVIPLGMGQRELILGGRKTGKTTFLKMTAHSQKNSSTIIIYALIGKKLKDIEDIHQFFEKSGLLEKAIIVASSASDSTALITLTPFTAMTIAEYFRDQGINTLVILDDLSNHAKFYREISLLAKKLPGRESYPGDIFYLHARLLERAGNFNINGKEVAITCLPIAESLGDDITGFIPTNLMSITDGHLFFDPKLYSQGTRPAINPYLSVTRVGKQTQTPLKREITLTVLSLLTQYDQANKLAHLSSELSEETKELLKLGETLENLFQQYPGTIYTETEELILVGLVLLSFYKKIKIDINKAKENLKSKMKNKKLKEISKKLEKIDKLSDLLNYLENYYKIFV